MNHAFDPRQARQANARISQMQANFTYATLKRLFSNMNAAELAAARGNESKAVAVAARQKYEGFFMSDIVNSKNPVIIANLAE